MKLNIVAVFCAVVFLAFNCQEATAFLDSVDIGRSSSAHQEEIRRDSAALDAPALIQQARSGCLSSSLDTAISSFNSSSANPERALLSFIIASIQMALFASSSETSLLSAAMGFFSQAIQLAGGSAPMPGLSGAASGQPLPAHNPVLACAPGSEAVNQDATTALVQELSILETTGESPAAAGTTTSAGASASTGESPAATAAGSASAGTADTGATSAGPGYSISPRGRQQLRDIVTYARNNHRGASRGYCFNAVWGYMTRSTYGKLSRWGDLPRMQSGEARHLAEYLNASQANLNEAGLQRLDTLLSPPITNPHDPRIPDGAVIVVAAGSTGTAHPTAGDVVVKAGNRFINDGPNMYYGTRDSWRGRVLGIYIPQ